MLFFIKIIRYNIKTVQKLKTEKTAALLFVKWKRNMTIDGKKIFRVRWQLLFVILPISIIPLIIIVYVSSNRIYQHIASKEIEFYSSVISQISYNVDALTNQSSLSIHEISNMDNFKKLLNAPPFKSAMEEAEFYGETREFEADTPPGSIRRSIYTKLNGDFFYIELDRKSFLTNTNYKLNFFSLTSLTINVQNLIKDPLFVELDKKPDKKFSIGKLSDNSAVGYDSDKRAAIIFPCAYDNSKRITKFIVYIFHKNSFENFYNDIENLKIGTLFFLDKNGKLILKNHPDPNDDYNYDYDKKSYIYDKTINEDGNMSFNDYQNLLTDEDVLKETEVSKFLNPDNYSYSERFSFSSYGNLESKVIKYKNKKYFVINEFSINSEFKYLFFLPIYHTQKPIFRLIIFIVLFTFLLIIVITYASILLSKYITDPIKELIIVAQKISTGNYKVKPVYIKSNNEIRLLQIAFNKMVKEINENTENLEKKVSERTEALQIANQEKTQYFINFTHETKTPLTLIKNYLDKYIKSHSADEDIMVVKQNIDKLLRDMINLLDVEKLSRNQLFYYNESAVNISEIISYKIKIFSEYASQKQINLTGEVEPSLFVKGDPAALDRIANNLIENSIKYTNPNGSIFVSVKKEDDKILFEVSDTGIGISEDHICFLFKPYHQLSSSKRNIQGIGMGLCIVKKIVESLGGEISVNSELGKGSKFTVMLAEYVEKNIPIADNTGLFENEPIYNQALSDLTECKFNENMKSILIVDDNRDILKLLQTSLSDKYNVLLATGGEEAIRKLESSVKPELIISDIMMDGLNGNELLSKIMLNEELKDISFVFLTAKTSGEEKIKGLTAGALDYIFKPFEMDEVRAKVDSIIRNKEAQNKKNVKDFEKKISSMLSSNKSSALEIKTEAAVEVKDLKLKSFETLCLDYKISNKEKEVIKHILDGLYNKEISDILNISLKTVEFHIHNIYNKLDIHNRIELIKIFKF